MKTLHKRLRDTTLPGYGGHAHGETSQKQAALQCRALSETMLLVADVLEGKVTLTEEQAKDLFYGGLKFLRNDQNVMRIGNLFKTMEFNS